MYDNSGENENFRCLHITDVEKFEILHIWHVCDVENVAMYAKFMPKFTRFHLEKNLAQKYICGEKMTYMRSERIDNEYIQFCNRKLKIEDEGHISTRSR